MRIGAYKSIGGIPGPSMLLNMSDGPSLPQVKRIGAYKSAGDQLLRSTMAEEQREQLSEIQVWGPGYRMQCKGIIMFKLRRRRACIARP